MAFDTAAAAAENVIDGEITDLQTTTPKPVQMAVRAEISPDDLRNQIRRQQELRSIMTDYLKSQMIEGYHYYYFNKLGKQGQSEVGGPRDDKPALTQEGSYNLLSLFKCVPGSAINQIIRHSDGHLTVVSEVPLYNQDGALVATGNGSCTTREAKYAYRKGERTCPECGGAYINKSKFPPKGNPKALPGWYCYAKIGGCGAEFDAKDARIVEQVVGRVENPDLADLENTVLKMAVKRSTSAAVKKLSLVSEIFATDPAENETPEPPAKHATAPKPTASKPETAPQSNGKVKTAVDLAKKLQDLGVEFEDLATMFLPEGLGKFEDLSEAQAANAIPAMAELVNTKIEEQKKSDKSNLPLS
jgi:hypothetical protein